MWFFGNDSAAFLQWPLLHNTGFLPNRAFFSTLLVVPTGEMTPTDPVLRHPSEYRRPDAAFPVSALDARSRGHYEPVAGCRASGAYGE
jgi:hypothetical protein